MYDHSWVNIFWTSSSRCKDNIWNALCTAIIWSCPDRKFYQMFSKLYLHWVDITRSTRIAPGWTLNSIIMSLPKYKTHLEWHSRTQLRCVRVLNEMHSRAQLKYLHSRVHWNWFAFACSIELHSCAQLKSFAFIPSSIKNILHSRAYRPDRWSRRFWHRCRFRLTRDRSVHLGDLFDNTRLLWC